VSALRGKRILVVEDEALIAVMLEDMLADLGAVLAGSAGQIDEAIVLARSTDCDAAVLDVNINGALVFPAADLLKARGIPIVFATGYGSAAVPATHRAPVIEKPYTRDKLERALADALMLPTAAVLSAAASL
jgi:CheY-like chemotaxis protein